MKKLFSILLCILLLSGCANTYDGPTVEKTVTAVREEEFYGSGDGTVTQFWRTEYAYDIYGNRSVILEYQKGEPYLKSVMTYDEGGHELRQVQYDLSGWLPKKIVDARYTYDDQGRLTSTRHHAGGLSWDDDTTVYDDEAMTRTVTTGEGAVAVDYLNETGWVMRTEQTFPDGRFLVTEYERSAEGWLLGTRTYENGELVDGSACTYDDQGRILTQTKIENGVSTLLFSWEYGDGWDIFTDHSNNYRHVTTYHPDGRMDTVETFGESGRLQSRTTYHYTEIQVPAEEVSP